MRPLAELGRRLVRPSHPMARLCGHKAVLSVMSSHSMAGFGMWMTKYGHPWSDLADKWPTLARLRRGLSFFLFTKRINLGRILRKTRAIGTLYKNNGKANIILEVVVVLFTLPPLVQTHTFPPPFSRKEASWLTSGICPPMAFVTTLFTSSVPAHDCPPSTPPIAKEFKRRAMGRRPPCNRDSAWILVCHARANRPI